MKAQLYSIYDTAAAMYKPLWALQTDAMAIREFTDIFDDVNPISKHPEHYFLVRLGHWENTNGKITPTDNETLITGLEALAAKNIQAQMAGNGVEPIAELRKNNPEYFEGSPGGTD